MVAIGDRETVALPPYSIDGCSALQKRQHRSPQYQHRFNQKQPLEERLVEHATRLREEAKALPPGIVREAILRRAEQAETGAHMTRWLRSPESKSNA